MTPTNFQNENSLRARPPRPQPRQRRRQNQRSSRQKKEDLLYLIRLLKAFLQLELQQH